jgi:hypothetical protein
MRFVEKSTAPAYYIICAAVRNVCRDFQPNETVMRFGVKLADFLRKLPALFANFGSFRIRRNRNAKICTNIQTRPTAEAFHLRARRI